jgi:hypothetical protein
LPNEVKNNKKSEIIEFFGLIKDYVVDHSYNLMLLGGIIGVIILFFISFLSYLYAVESVKDYFNSEAFKNIIISIAIPVIIFLWRIYDTRTKQREQDLKERRKQREQDLKERRKQREQDLKERRLESIKKTFEEWNKINSLVGQVRFCDGKDDPKLKEAQLKLAEHSISFGELISLWSSSFPVIPVSVISMFVEYTVTLYWGAWAIAYCIKNDCYETNRNYSYRQLQESLGIFQRGIVNLTFLSFGHILNDSSKLLEHIEENPEYDENIQREIINTIRIIIEQKLNDDFGMDSKLYEDVHEHRHPNYGKNIDKQKAEFTQQSSNNYIIETLIKLQKKVPSEEDIIKYINYTENEEIIKCTENYEQLSNHRITDNDLILSIIRNLLRYAYILKINELLLGIDIFWAGAVTPYFLRTLGLPHNPSDDIRSDKKDIDDDKNLPEKLKEDFEEIVKMIDIKSLQNKENQNNDHYEVLFNSNEYKEFVKRFYQMQSDDLLALIAAGAIDYIEVVGRTIRLERLLFYGDNLSPVS